MQLELMLPTTRKFPFSDPGWIFEPKWDGYRALCLIEHDSVRFMSRNKKELTKRFPEFSTINKSITAHSAILDGEIVGLDENNVPCFENLQNRKQRFIVYFVFDCLILNGNDLRNEPLIFRKGLLKRILKKSPRIRYTDHVVQEGKELFITVEKLGLEGIVGKKADSRYVGGRTRNSLGVRSPRACTSHRPQVSTRFFITSVPARVLIFNHSLLTQKPEVCTHRWSELGTLAISLAKKTVTIRLRRKRKGT